MKANTKIMRLYDLLLTGLAVVSALMLAALFAVIVLDVTMRSLGLQPPIWTTSVTEYSLLYLTTLAAPWLLRHHGHVTLTTALDQMSPALRLATMRLAYVIGSCTCLVIAYVSMQVTLSITGYDIRSFPVPRWLVLVTMPVGFTLLAVEFGRLAYVGDFPRGPQEH